jgi:hypothetical protein
LRFSRSFLQRQWLLQLKSQNVESVKRVGYESMFAL